MQIYKNGKNEPLLLYFIIYFFICIAGFLFLLSRSKKDIEDYKGYKTLSVFNSNGRKINCISTYKDIFVCNLKDLRDKNE